MFLDYIYSIEQICFSFGQFLVILKNLYVLKKDEQVIFWYVLLEISLNRRYYNT